MYYSFKKQILIYERPDAESGRFGEESKRLRSIIDKLTQDSMLLMNESFSSTYAGESLYIAKDIITILSQIGIRCAFTTHLLELAKFIEEINLGDNIKSKVISLISDVKEENNEIIKTYKIIKGPPLKYSYAKVIAKKYGISYDQLNDLVKNKNL